MSTIMEIVGAGGIGAELIREMGIRQYQKSFAILLVILMTLILIDLEGSKLQNHLK